jgi:23S rRNA (guanosine2251-2'-O)-methyltransferase
VASSRRDQRLVGRKPILEALQEGSSIEKIYLLKGSQHESLQEIRQLAAVSMVPVQEVPQPKLNRFYSGNHQGAIAFLSGAHYQRLSNLIPGIYDQGASPFLIFLDGVTDVRNYGAIARTALGSGAHGLVIAMRDAAPSNPDAIQASMGALRQITVCRENSIQDAIREAKNHGLKVFGLEAGAQQLNRSLDLQEPVAWVLGSEEKGLHPQSRKLCDELISLPMPGPINSYNVSVAAAMVCYETASQRI